jgi:hypothetical protein
MALLKMRVCSAALAWPKLLADLPYACQVLALNW